MKVLIVFTTRNPSSNEQFNTTWKCIKPKQKNFLRGKALANGMQINVFNGKKFNSGGDWDYQKICKKISGIRDNKQAFLAVLFHDSEPWKLAEKCAKNGISVDSENFLIRDYSTATTENRIWDDYISNFCADEERLCEKFDALWNYLWGEDAFKKVYSLRYEILSPLVALDLINQVEANNERIKIDNDIKKRVKEDICALTKNDEKQKKNSIEALCDYIQCDSFRGELENLVIDGSSSLKIDRNDLEDIAKRMEEQIARLEY